jgi:biofilm regulator BssR
MSVSENDHLRENLFELCREMRAQAPRLQHVISPEEKDALRLAGESVAAAAVCLMSGHHDCPLYIAVNVEKLERCLTGLTSNIHKLNKLSPILMPDRLKPGKWMLPLLKLCKNPRANFPAGYPLAQS